MGLAIVSGAVTEVWSESLYILYYTKASALSLLISLYIGHISTSLRLGLIVGLYCGSSARKEFRKASDLL